MERMKTQSLVRARIATINALAIMALCITGCVVFSGMRSEPGTELVSAIQLHGGRIEYHDGIGSMNSRVKAISIPAPALETIDPLSFEIFPRLRVLHLTGIPAGTEGERYETACCVNGREELIKLVAEYRKAGLVR